MVFNIPQYILRFVKRTGFSFLFRPSILFSINCSVPPCTADIYMLNEISSTFCLVVQGDIGLDWHIQNSALWPFLCRPLYRTLYINFGHKGLITNLWGATRDRNTIWSNAVEFKLLAWSSIAQSVCEWAFSLLANRCLETSRFEYDMSPLDSNIACLCQSIEINNNKHVYRHSQVRKPNGSEVRWAECSLVIGTGCWVQVFSLILDSSVGLWVGIQSAGEYVSWDFQFESCIQQRKTTCLL